MPHKPVLVHKENSIATVVLNRPDKLNALSLDLLSGLEDVIADLAADSAVRGVIVTGEGKAFCAGADIGAMMNMEPLEAAAFAGRGQRVLFSLEEMGKPVIAAVNGPAIGGGLEVALACDFILASTEASFAFPEIKLGIIPGFGGTQRLSRLVGKAAAKEMIFSGERINAEEAFRIGLANRVYEPQSLLNEAKAMMEKIVSRGLLSLRLAKEVIDAGSDIDLKNACMMERDAFALCFSSHDQKEGMAAFIEKRPARFREA